ANICIIYSNKYADIVFDLERDLPTLQYMIKISQGTPRREVKLVVDLGGKLPWFGCRKEYNSSSYRAVSCGSSQCSQADKPVNSCLKPYKKTCSIYIRNPVTRSVGKGELISDIVTVKSNPVPSNSRFAFGCAAASHILSGLAKASKGVAGLGPDRVLTYTPLLVNPKSKDEYFINVKIDQGTRGIGGNKIDIRIPYTTLETSIYKAFIKAHTEWVDRLNIANAELMDFPNITMVAPVAPFTTCYDSSNRIECPSVVNNGEPSVSFVFPTNVCNISFFDLVIAKQGVACVAFVDGGSNPMTSIVIGARQIGFLEFDISRSRLGFEQPNLNNVLLVNCYDHCFLCLLFCSPIVIKIGLFASINS
ncbi:hypothetical protein MKX01_016573, partial [Papaver californicum]